MNVGKFALRNAKVIAFTTGILALLGVRAYFQTPQSVYPAMSFSRVDVVADVGDYPPDRVRSAVTLPLEGALQALPSVSSVRSTSSEGSAELVADFEQGTDPQSALQYVDRALAQSRAAIPAAQNVRAVIVNANSEPVLSFAFMSPTLSQATLRALVRDVVLPKLYGASGLGRVLLVGGPLEEYHVDLNPAALAANAIGANDVSKTVADATSIAAVGLAERAYQRYGVLIDADVRDARALGEIPVATRSGASVPLSALGNVALGVSPETNQASFGGTHAVILNAYALPNADLVGMGRDVRGRIEAAARSLPRDVRARVFWDQTTFIVNSQRALRDAILLGALLAIIVIHAFLRDARLTLVAAAVIPLAMAIAVFALQLAHQTLNLMSVGGLAVAVGLIIDDAIVVIEGIASVMRDDPALPVRAAIARALGRLSSPMIASTTTTVVVFVPLALLGGVPGFFFRALAFTLSASIVVSLALALFLAPVVARVLLEGRKTHAERRDPISPVLARYDGVLRFALRRRTFVCVAALLLLGITAVLLTRLPSDFLPQTDEGKFEIAYQLPTGVTLAASDAAATAMERIVTSDSSVEAVGRFTGIDSNGYSPTTPNAGLLRVTLRPPAERVAYDAVGARLRDRLQAAVPAANLSFRQILEDQINDLQGGSAAPIEIDVRGEEQATLIEIADRITKAISNVAGVVDASDGIVYDDPSLRITPAGGRLAALGLSGSDLGDALGALAQGSLVASVAGAGRSIPVRVRVAALGGALSPDLPVFAGGRESSLDTLARVRVVRRSSNLGAENGSLVVRVTSNVENRPLSDVIRDIARVVKSVALPPGYGIEITGQAKAQARAFSEFATVIGIAVALVFAVMLAAFKSFRLPLVVLTAIPQALIGVAVALAITRTPLNISSFMGLLLLVGIVVKNGILLVDVANERRAVGDGLEESLAIAGRTRLRPIVMTTLAAIGGLLPLAIGFGQGAELEKPLAIAVIGGLSTATIFTLGVIPVLYATFAGNAVARAAATPLPA